MFASLASTNVHKLEELRRALPDWKLARLEANGYPEEDGETYFDNASAKARFGRRLAEPAAWVLGEDSGLEVDGLGGRPGVHSNRWAVPGEDHVDKLLGELEAVEGEGSRARYVCELVCVSPELEQFRGTGVLEGVIARERRGSEGFGYDPVFVPDGETRTVAELGDEWKARHSHRARAAGSLLREIAAGQNAMA